MSRMKFINEVVSQAQDCIDSLSELIAMLESNNSPKKEAEKAYSLEEVRAVLADLSRSGFTDDVRKLIKDYGANKLSEVESSRYADLMKDAKVIGHD
ncbi:hypothetical protein [Maledivibacter halophilus]|uniref:rRNA biogenesis protein rrp5 n=1 Tax=Maledivibacter halophilus TaxID=36842 RepID=A0A1T5K359_9FIRM|nr:hypothetical protein [Maledivibacter halophilus]SKC58071.1 hypothetical protein SAMN02194393_01579 [Maledivibacter halophilus]